LLGALPRNHAVYPLHIEAAEEDASSRMLLPPSDAGPGLTDEESARVR